MFSFLRSGRIYQVVGISIRKLSEGDMLPIYWFVRYNSTKEERRLLPYYAHNVDHYINIKGLYGIVKLKRIVDK